VVCPEIVLDEESPVTMQLAMVGNDGALLASDKQWVTLLRHGTHGPSYTVRRAPKIRVSKDGKLAVSSSIDMIDATAIADRIVSKQAQIKEGNEIECLRKIVRPLVGRNEIQCLIVIIASRPKLFRMINAKMKIGAKGARIKWHLDIHPADGCIDAGDLPNPAKFWHIRYYDDSRSVDELCRLAARVISDAQSLNRMFIGDLEIATAKNARFSLAPPEECKALLAQARSRSSDLANLIFSETLLRK
jgi:hypothetical protein